MNGNHLPEAASQRQHREMIFQTYIHQMLIIRIFNQFVDHKPVVKHRFQQMRHVFIFKPLRILRDLSAIPIHDDLRFMQAVIPRDRPFQDKDADDDVGGVRMQAAENDDVIPWL